MAEQLALVKRTDLSSDISSLSLLTWLSKEGWQMSLGDGESQVDEAMTLHIPGTSDNNLAVNIQALDALIVQVTHFKNPLEPYGVWLRAQIPGETGARQALVLEAQRDKALVSDPFAKNHVLRDYVLGLKRTSAWEATTPLVVSFDELDSLGGMVDIGEVKGDVGARPAQLIVNANVGITPLESVWLGFRSNRFGTPANFVPRWEAEAGTLSTNVTITDANDDTAVGGAEIIYAAENPAITDDSFVVLHSPVKVQSITVQATLDGTVYELTDHFGDGVISTVPVEVSSEVTDDERLDNVLISPATVHFYALGREVAHDDGEGVIVPTNRFIVDETLSGVNIPPTGTLTNLPLESSVQGSWNSGVDTFHDNGAGILIRDSDSEPIGIIDYETADVFFQPGASVTRPVLFTYWTDDAGGLSGTIDYVTGLWTYWEAGADAPTTAAYIYGSVTGTFNYLTGGGHFDTAGVSSITVTYTSYENRSIRVTFVDPTMQPRWYMSVEEAAPQHPTDQAGKMQVLGRFKVSDSSTICRVRLESGFSGTITYHKRAQVVVSGEDWKLYPLGQVSFPETGRALEYLNAISKQRLRIAASLYEGTGVLDMDCLIMIPIDEGFVGMSGQTDLVALVDPLYWPVTISQSADGKVTAIGSDGSSKDGDPGYSDITAQITGGLPPGSNIHVVLAVQRSAGSDRLTMVDIDISAYERWLTLRGAE